MSELFKGKVFAFEGLDGAGKTTHIKQLVDDLENFGLRVAAVANPGPNLVGRILRANIGSMDADKKTELFTYDIERTQRQLSPFADVVIWDRHLDTVKVSNVDDGENQVEARAGKIARPDKVIYLDIPPDVSWERESQSSDHPIDREWISAKDRRYKALREKHPGHFEVIDATQPLHVVYQALSQLFREELGSSIERSRQINDLLLNTPGVIEFRQDNPAEVKPGVFLPMFVNLKNTWSNPEIRGIFAQKLADLIGEEYEWICGLESGGSFYAVSIATALNRAVSLYRKGAKEYGDGSFMVGEIPPPGTKVALIDDVYATGQSASRAVQQLKAVGCEASLFSIFSYSSDVEMKKRLGANATALSYFKGIRQHAIEQGKLTPQEAELLTSQVNDYRNTMYR